MQAYTSAEASPAGRDAARQAFLEHCRGIHAASSGTKQSLVRPAAWPVPLAAARFASDSQLSTLSRDAAPLEAYSAQLAAANLVLTVQPEQLAHVWAHPQLASCLPAGLLQAALAGLAAPALPAEVQDAQADRQQQEGQLRLLWFGALCCLEQQMHSSHQQLLIWLRMMEASLQVRQQALGCHRCMSCLPTSEAQVPTAVVLCLQSLPCLTSWLGSVQTLSDMHSSV